MFRRVLIVGCSVIFLVTVYSLINEKKVVQQEEIVISTLDNDSSNESKDLDPSSLKNELKVIKSDKVSSSFFKKKAAYEDDWCVASLELSEKDFAFAMNESKEWRLKRGDFSIPQKDIYGNYFDNDAKNDIVPYMEMDKDKLLELANQDDQYAMVAVLRRAELGKKIKILMAHRLMILGSTSLAPQFLVLAEMNRAKSQYRRYKKLTPDIKGKVMSALAYVAYGINNYDLSALAAYLQVVSRAPSKDNRDLVLLLSKDDYQMVSESARDIKRQISEFREQENLSYLDDQDLPKIAIHDFQSRLAVLYVEHADALAALDLLTLDKGPSLKKSACIERYIKRFED